MAIFGSQQPQICKISPHCAPTLRSGHFSLHSPKIKEFCKLLKENWTFGNSFLQAVILLVLERSLSLVFSVAICLHSPGIWRIFLIIDYFKVNSILLPLHVLNYFVFACLLLKETSPRISLAIGQLSLRSSRGVKKVLFSGSGKSQRKPIEGQLNRSQRFLLLIENWYLKNPKKRKNVAQKSFSHKRSPKKVVPYKNDPLRKRASSKRERSDSINYFFTPAKLWRSLSLEAH